MRMRTEAAKLPQDRPSARDHPMDASLGSSSLPQIGYPGSIGASHNLTIGMNYNLTKSRKVDPVKQDNEVERASGISDYMASGGVFADRTKMTMPTASCVRCGEFASTCMSCTEYLAEEALNFYRKTRARGAASLFANAITQTGITTVVKYIMYSLWKNSFRIRKWSSKKRAFKADVIARTHYMKMCFKAWTDYRTMNKVDRRDKEIERLTKRVASLEAATTQANNLKTAAETKLNKIEKSMNGFLETIDTQSNKIDLLESLLYKERSRVVGLSSLTLPILKFNDLTSDLSNKDNKEIHRKLFNAAASQQLAYEYGKTFNNEDLEIIIDSENKRRKNKKRYKADELDEDVEIVDMLFQWASSKSRDAGTNNCPQSGKTLESWLPKYKKINNFDDFKNGSILMRLVVALLWDMPQPGFTTLKLAHPDDMPITTSNPDEEDEIDASKKFDPIASIDEIKASMKTPFELITCALALAEKWLGLPAFEVGDFVACAPNIITITLSHLMLASASPAQTNNSLSKVSAIINSYERATSTLEFAKRNIELNKVAKIKTAWAILHGLEEVQVVEVSANANVIEVEDTSSSPEGKDNSEGVNETKDGVENELEGSEGEIKDQINESIEVVATISLPQEESTPGLSNYSSLAIAIDDYLSLFGETDPDTFAYENPEGLLPKQINEFYESMSDLEKVKIDVNEHLSKQEQVMRVGNTARSTIAKFQTELLCSELKWLST
jgi:hypothetical protein